MKRIRALKILTVFSVLAALFVGVGAVNTAYWGPFGAWNLDIDDGSGDSPWLGVTDGDDAYLRIQKLDAGAATLTQSEGALNLLLAGDSDDYLTITTTTNVPTIGTSGSCNLTITSSGGTIDFDDENLTTTGTFTYAGGESTAGLDLDDGVGDSPALTFTDADDETLTVTKLDSGGSSLADSDGAILVQPSNDTDDYISLTTTGDVPIIGTVGSCNLQLTASSGTISMDDDNLTTTGTITGAKLLGSTGADADFDDTEELNTGLGASYGILICRDTVGGTVGIYRLENQSIVALSLNAAWTVTDDNEGTFNVYWDTDHFEIENQVADNKNVSFLFIGF